MLDALANIGSQYARLVNGGDHRTISTFKQAYLDYLHRMLSSMKSVYLVFPHLDPANRQDMKDTESEDLVQYISLAQHVVGNIIQYCASFVKEVDRTFKDLPILDYFVNGETFPQPGSNEMAYAAQRLRGVARKDSNRPFSNGTQADLFWSVKSFLEKTVRNGRQEDFVEFCELALEMDTNVDLNDHVVALRTFIVEGMFCEYLRMAAEVPEVGNPVWSYVLPCLMAARDIYGASWKRAIRDDELGLRRFVDELTEFMIAMQSTAVIAAGQVRLGDCALYSLVCGWIFDFVVLVENVVWSLNTRTALSGMSFHSIYLTSGDYQSSLARLLGIYQCIAKGNEIDVCDQSWVDGLVQQRSNWTYVRGAVRREVRMDLPHHLEGCPTEKIEEIWSLALGKKPVYMDDLAAMYIV